MANEKIKLVEEYNEESGTFVPLSTTLRNMSSDRTPLTGPFVSFYQDLLDMIDGEEGTHGRILDVDTITKEDGSQQIKISYEDGYIKLIDDQDKYVSNVSLSGNTIYFTRNDGATMPVTLDYYTKTEVNNTVTSAMTSAVTEAVNTVSATVETQIKTEVEEQIKKVENQWEKF